MQALNASAPPSKLCTLSAHSQHTLSTLSARLPHILGASTGEGCLRPAPSYAAQVAVSAPTSNLRLTKLPKQEAVNIRILR